MSDDYKFTMDGPMESLAITVSDYCPNNQSDGQLVELATRKLVMMREMLATVLTPELLLAALKS